MSFYIGTLAFHLRYLYIDISLRSSV